MSINRNELQKLLDKMLKTHIAGERAGYNVSVRTQKFIRILHDYAIQEIKKSGILKKSKLKILAEAKVPGFFKMKNVDILVYHEIAGPLLIISVKSIMSSITNNFTNTYESMIGDVMSLHARYPYLVMCHLFLLPKEVIKRKETYPIKYYARLLSKINGRNSEINDFKKYERIALLVVDFKKHPPQIVKDTPSERNMRIENYFDDISRIFKERTTWLN